MGLAEKLKDERTEIQRFNPDSKLREDESGKSFLLFKIKEIVDIILDEYQMGDEIVKLVWEVKGTEINEIKKPEPENFKNIKPENGMTGKESSAFWNNEFKKETEYYTTNEKRLEKTPKEDSDRGLWKGERGESKFVPNSETAKG